MSVYLNDIIKISEANYEKLMNGQSVSGHSYDPNSIYLVEHDFRPDWSEILNNPFPTSAIGSTTSPVYWTGSKLAVINSLGSFAWKSSLAFSDLTNKPTTLSGYGITDEVYKIDSSTWTKNISPASITFQDGAWVKVPTVTENLVKGIYLLIIEDQGITYSGVFTYLTGNITTQEEIILHACGTRATYEGSDKPGILYAKIGFDQSESTTTGRAYLYLAYSHNITNTKLTIKIKKLATL